jgi:hypothetical protein
MDFRIEPTTAFEEFGAPPEESPEANFIDLNYPALAGKWVHDGEVFVARYEDESPEHDEASLRAVLAKLQERRGRAYAMEEFMSAPQASYGVLVFQSRAANTMHVEYLVEQLRSEAIPPATYPRRDDVSEDALRHWLLEQREEVSATVRDRAGELR